MSTRPSVLLGVSILIGAGSVRAGDDSAPQDLREHGSNAWGARGRLELKGAFALHDHTVDAGSARTSAAGNTVSHLAGGGAWMAERRPLGVSAGLALERFALQPTNDPSGDGAMPVTGLEASAGLLARVGGPEALAALEGQLGYAFARVPILAPPEAGAAPMTARASSLQGHGPAAEARLTIRLASSFDLEASGRILPILFGARAQGTSVSLRRYGGGGGARVGLIDLGTMRVSGLVGYEADVTEGSGGAMSVHQVQHRFGIGLRASMPQARPGEPPAAVVASAAPEPVTTPSAPRVRGVVRAAGQGPDAAGPLAEVSVLAPDGRAVVTDAEGRFELEQLTPGLTELRFSREGFQDKAEVVSVPAQGELELEIELVAAAAPASAALIGQIRKEDGTPVEAQVRILELGVRANADRQGRFRFDVPPGRYTIVIDSPGFVSQRKSGPVGAGEQTIFNIELQRQR